MKISDNFDRWMFDYKEGNLSPAEVEEFENFLLNHPEYEMDADAWDMAFIESEPVIYPHAEKLEKKRRVAGWYYWGAAAALVTLLGSTAIYMFTGAPSLETTIQSHQSLQENGTSQDVSGFSTADHTTLSDRSHTLFSQLTNTDLADFYHPEDADSYNANSTNVANQQGVQQSLAGGSGNGSSQQPNENGVVLEQGNFGKSQTDLVALESGKLEGENNSGKYTGNPESKGLGFDVTKKATVKSGSSYSAFRKIYHRVERMLGYPVGLTNLRDPELLTPQSSLLAFNSSFAGGMLCPRFEMNYRNQWLGSDQNSSELNISYDNYSYGLRGGVGILVNAQDYGYGKFGDYNLSLFYSPKLVVNRNFVIEPSVKLTMGSMIANGDKLVPNSAFEMDRGRTLGTIGEDKMDGFTQQWYKDYGLGLMVNTKWFYAGFSSDNLNRHYENVYGNELSSPSKTPVRLSGIIGTDYVSKNKSMTFSPFVAYQQYGDQPELWAGMNYRLGTFTLGGSISNDKEFTASVGLKFETFKLVYHYDYTESALTQTRMGSHNIGIRINAKRKNQRLTH